MRWLLALTLLLSGCQRSRQLRPIGSACQRDEECGSGRFAACAADHVGGYCVAGCGADSQCPSGTVCVAADALSSGACHKLCATAADCRPGYSCDAAGNDASHDYCDTPGSRTLLRRIRSRAWR